MQKYRTIYNDCKAIYNIEETFCVVLNKKDTIITKYSLQSKSETEENKGREEVESLEINTNTNDKGFYFKLNYILICFFPLF